MSDEVSSFFEFEVKMKANREAILLSYPYPKLLDKHLDGARLLSTRERMLTEMPQCGIVAEIGVAAGEFSSEIRLFAEFNGKEISYYCAVRLSYPVSHSKRGFLFDSFRSFETLGQSPLTTGFCCLSLPT